MSKFATRNKQRENLQQVMSEFTTSNKQQPNMH